MTSTILRLLQNCCILLIAMIALAGCKTYQDVGPLLESARLSFEQTRALERQALEIDRQRQAVIVTRAFDQLEASVLHSLRTLVISAWDPVEKDFKADDRSQAWAGWFGVNSFEAIPRPIPM